MKLCYLKHVNNVEHICAACHIYIIVLFGVTFCIIIMVVFVALLLTSRRKLNRISRVIAQSILVLEQKQPSALILYILTIKNLKESVFVYIKKTSAHMMIQD